MPETLVALLWFLPWCWFVNISLNILWYFFKPRLPWLLKTDRSFDCGVLFFDGRPLLGTSTTWGGLLQVIVLGSIGEYFFSGHLFLLAAILVFFGHAIGSFIKRRLGLPRGAFVFGIDHADYIFVVGGMFILLGRLSIVAFILSLVCTYVLTPLLTMGMYALQLRSERL